MNPYPNDTRGHIRIPIHHGIKEGPHRPCVNELGVNGLGSCEDGRGWLLVGDRDSKASLLESRAMIHGPDKARISDQQGFTAKQRLFPLQSHRLFDLLTGAANSTKGGLQGFTSIGEQMLAICHGALKPRIAVEVREETAFDVGLDALAEAWRANLMAAGRNAVVPRRSSREVVEGV